MGALGRLMVAAAGLSASGCTAYNPSAEPYYYPGYGYPAYGYTDFGYQDYPYPMYRPADPWWFGDGERRHERDHWRDEHRHDERGDYDRSPQEVRRHEAAPGPVPQVHAAPQTRQAAPQVHEPS